MDKKQIISNCLLKISLLRNKEQNEADLNFMKACEIPEFVNLEKEKRILIFEIGKLQAYGKNTVEKEEKLNLIKQKIKNLLIKNKIEPNSLVPNYTCKECNDTGFVNGIFCKCLKNKVREEVLKNCGIQNKNLCSFKEFNSEIFSNKKQKLQLLKVKDIFEKISDKFPLVKQNFIVISGKTGVGKTFITKCLAFELINKGFIVSFVSAFEMNKLLCAYHTCFDENKQNYIEALIDSDILIIDDLGIEPILKNVTIEYLYVILSERSKFGRLTVITTNLDGTGILNRYNERIFSRLINKNESIFIKIEGDDLRIKGSEKNG